ncbi:DEAD/DEAH box helicase family protein, partial [Candidatus Saccharibacteria bacterium]|nr:DEAD/DEAH box helicase family protein [Candidatus Saccharibacteria bacterium]
MRSFIDHSEFESNNTSQLRPHQQEAFDDIIDALNNGQRSGFVEMATGSGKTAIMSKLAELYLTDNSGRVIFLAPSLQICQQINEEIRKHTSVADDSITFMSGAQTVDPAANIIISTYQSYVTKGRDLSNVGLILADECHRSLGPITSGIVKEGHPDSYKIGFSATPSFRANRRSEELFGQPMHNLSLRDAVESGVAQPVEAFVYKTEAEFNPSDRVAKDFTYQELEPLMNNAARNKAGVNLTKELVADGRQGIINCIPGKSNGHARALAEILSKTSIATADGQK